MKRRQVSLTLFALLSFTLTVGAARAAVITLDMDPGTPGIQSSLTVAPGTPFSVSVIFVGDGTTVFDLYNIDLNFNNLGTVLGTPIPGPLSLLAGSIVGPFPLTATDLFGPGLGVAPGSPMTPSPFGSSPDPPFASSIDGGVLLFSLSLPPPLFGPFSVGTPVELATLTLEGLMLGMSALAFDEGLTGIADSGGSMIPILTYGTGSVTVMASGMQPVPEPSSMIVWLLGSALVVARMHRRKMRASVG